MDKKSCFEWGIGANDLRSVSGGKTAADNPPLFSHAVEALGVERRVSPLPRRLGRIPVSCVIRPILTV
jgi:hypothetical protein